MKKSLLAGVAVLSLAMPQVVKAQEPTQGEVQLEPIIVKVGGGSEIKGYVPKKTTAGSKSNVDIKDVPQAVSVIGREEFSDRGIVNKIDETLRYTPGVASEPFGTDPDTDWLYIRGFDASQKGLFLDDLSLISYSFGNFQIDPFLLERVDVLKGPASVLYGGANAGGIINMIRKRPVAEPLFYTEAGINNFGNAYTGIDISDKLTDDETILYRLTAKGGGGDNYADFSEEKRGSIMPQVTFSPDDGTSFTVYGMLSALDQVHVTNGFLPYVGTVVDAPFGKIDRDAYFGEPDSDTGVYVQKMVGYELKHELDNGVTLSQNLRYGHLHKHENFAYTYGYAGGAPTGPDYLLTRFGFDATSYVNNFAVDNRAEAEFDLGGASHSFLAGLDYKRYSLDHVQSSPTAGPISANDPVYGGPLVPNAPYLDEVITQNQIGVYVQDQIRFGDGWLTTLNGRYDVVGTEKDSAIAADYDTSDTALSGRAGLTYEFANGVTPYVSAATFFNPLIGVSATNTPFSPEKGHQFEAGIKYEPDFVDGLFTISAFQLTKQNVAVTVPGTFTQVQRGEVEARGLELEGKLNLDDNWKILASASWIDSEVTKDLNAALIGKTPVIVPETQASLWLDYSFTSPTLEGVSAGAGLRYQGESWADDLNTRKVPAAALMDMAVRYTNDDWTASLNVANLFDKEYVKGCQGLNVCGYGESRTISFKLSRSW